MLCEYLVYSAPEACVDVHLMSVCSAENHKCQGSGEIGGGG